MDISAVIPAYNEAQRIAAVIQATQPLVTEVVVVDDGSLDGTGNVAAQAGAFVLRQANAGYIAAIKRGFHHARGHVVVTLDADGEHGPEDIPRLVAPIQAGEADLVLDARSHVPRLSESFLNRLSRLRVKSVSDTGTGFRMVWRDLALRLEL